MLDVNRPLGVVHPAVVEYQLCVVQERLEGWVLVRVQLVLHRAEVWARTGQAENGRGCRGGLTHGSFDDLVVIDHFLPVDRIQERPCVGVGLHIPQQTVHEIVLSALRRQTRTDQTIESAIGQPGSRMG